MGEYAIRSSDGQQVKIGTCEQMYYLRFEDRTKVRPLSGNVNPGIDKVAGELRFRVPFEDEDETPIGEYDDFDRGQPLYRSSGNHEYFTDETKVSEPGLIQLRHDCGLLINVRCYHGMKLPNASDDLKPFWNGKGYSFELRSLRGVYEDGQLTVWPVVGCAHCGEQWRYNWAEIWEWLPLTLRFRLQAYKDQIELVAA